jgi:hypothetical protein
MYSNGMADTTTDTNIRDHGERHTGNYTYFFFSISLIVLFGVGISVYKINRNLRYEPMDLLSRQKE